MPFHAKYLGLLHVFSRVGVCVCVDVLVIYYQNMTAYLFLMILFVATFA